MTSRRAIPGYEQRVSRALQFRPGHAGGRVDSAQPVRRRGGTLRGPAVGAAGAAVACSTEWPRTAMAATTATFAAAEPYGFIAVNFRLFYTSTEDAQVRVASVSLAAGTDATPTEWEPLPAAPGGGEKAPNGFILAAYGGSLTGWVIEWDTPGVVSDMCSEPVDNG